MWPFAATLASAALLGGCGLNGDPIPRDNAQQMLDQISAAQDAFTANECTTNLRTAVDNLHNEVADLPSTVSEDIRKALSSGVDRLDSLASTDCNVAAPVVDTTTTEALPTETTKPPKTVPEETDTEPTDTEETDTETTDTETTIDPTLPPGQQKPPKEKPPKIKPPKGGPEGFTGGLER